MPTRGGSGNRRKARRSINLTTRAVRVRPSARVTRALPSTASEPSPPPPGPTNPIVTETGDEIITEDLDFIIQE